MDPKVAFHPPTHTQAQIERTILSSISQSDTCFFVWKALPQNSFWSTMLLNRTLLRGEWAQNLDGNLISKEC